MIPMRHRYAIALVVAAMAHMLVACDVVAREPASDSPPQAGQDSEAQEPGAGPFAWAKDDPVPWAEAGPGWFLIEFDPFRLPVEDDSDDSPFVERPWFAAVSPDGEIYLATDPADGQFHFLQAWTHAGVHGFNHLANGDEDESDRVLVSLPSGSLTDLEDVPGASNVMPAAGDYMLGTNYSVDPSLGGMSVSYRASTGEFVANVCGVEAASARSGLSPDGTKILCLVEHSDEATLVVRGTVAGEATELSVLPRRYEAYQLHGWLDNATYLISQRGPDGEREYLRLDVATGEATTTVDPLPFLDPIDSLFWTFHPELDAYVAPVSTGVALYDDNGEHIVTVDCSYGCTTHQSGGYFLVVERGDERVRGVDYSQEVAITLVDVRDGSVVDVLSERLSVGAFEEAVGFAEAYHP